MTAIQLNGLSKTFADGTVAVHDLNLTVDNGEFLVLLGPSGCGKSTVLRMIAGLEQPTAGEVLLDGEPVTDVHPSERQIAMIFQNYALYPHMTAGENIGFPLRLRKHERAEVDARVAHLATILDITDTLARRPGRLSGGQRQRVAMGRALARRPRVFLMDEPLSNIDSGLRAQLRAEISALVRELNVTTVYVTHDQTEALTMADRVAVLRHGALQDVGTPNEIYHHPATAYVAAFLGTPRMTLFRAKVLAHLDDWVRLQIGEQSLDVPGHDVTAHMLRHYHGEEIIVGMRPEALRLPDREANDPVLHARVRHMEHAGHESLAHLDVGATAAPLDMTEATPKRSAPARRGLFRRATAAAAHPPDAHVERHLERPVELTLRLAPYPRLAAGDRLTVQVDPRQLHFFGDRGERIGAGQQGRRPRSGRG
ncbi:sugar ABC transporter ATP-binding protein [Actinorhabdospora filicis]|uniref:Sugar ABC transporter ATP-binding protein n=1 Tax=Actinorhabdospora filicis TaxID=1785913 RepID=A0A9W6W811_9ACTN|nr:ABC transporter ATP-binding protein [Actinorhabdospora filicis]GLZ76011.1 sugar ABC transporter ATP-binding protein [Actinorhabdospora filicis]